MDTARAIDRFLESPALSDATRRAYRADLDEFAAWLRARRLGLDGVAGLDQGEVREGAEERDVAEALVRLAGPGGD